MASTKDKMQDVMPLSFDFKLGEQPSSIKLTKWAQLTDLALENVVAAIGDPWDYQPHTSSGSSRYFLSPENLSQINLARFSGPSSYISPTGNTVGEQMPSSVSITLGSNRNTWSLGFPLLKSKTTDYIISPLDDDTVLESIDLDQVGFGGAAEFTNRVASPSLLASDGDYCIDWRTGIISTYSITTSETTMLISENAELQFFGAGAPWTTSNVIPDWKDSGNGVNHTGGVIVTYVSHISNVYNYSITLPNMYGLPRVGDTNGMSGDGTVNSSTFGSEGSQYRLPYSLWTGTSSGDTVPEGFILLWDNDTSSIVPLVEFAVASTPYKLTISCPQLGGVGTGTNNSRYRIITLGSSLAEAVGYLSAVVRNNTHSGLTGGTTVSKTLGYTSPISHSNLTERYSVTAAAPSNDLSIIDKMNFIQSKYPSNDHPQYIHRAGWMSQDTANSNNAMRGDIVFSGVDNFAVNSYGGTSTETYGVMFGGGDNSLDLPRLAFKGGGNLTPAGGGSDYANRLAFGIPGIGNKNLVAGLGDFYGALTYTPYKNTPLYIRGFSGGENLSPIWDGAIIAFDLGQTSELNYMKLRTAASYDSTDYHRPAEKTQTDFESPLSIMPGATGKVSLYDFREWRFRAVSHAPDSTNTSDLKDGNGVVIEELEKYYTSPGVVGADFINVYSNAIFFSPEGDGRKTSLCDAGPWFNGVSSASKPIGIHYEPESIGGTGGFRFVVGSSSSNNEDIWVGDYNSSIFSSTSRLWVGKYSYQGMTYDEARLSVNPSAGTSLLTFVKAGRSIISVAPGYDYEYAVQIHSKEAGGSIELLSQKVNINASSNSSPSYPTSSDVRYAYISTDEAISTSEIAIGDNDIVINAGSNFRCYSKETLYLYSNSNIILRSNRDSSIGGYLTLGSTGSATLTSGNGSDVTIDSGSVLNATADSGWVNLLAGPNPAGGGLGSYVSVRDGTTKNWNGVPTGGNSNVEIGGAGWIKIIPDTNNNGSGHLALYVPTSKPSGLSSNTFAVYLEKDPSSNSYYVKCLGNYPS